MKRNIIGLTLILALGLLLGFAYAQNNGNNRYQGMYGMHNRQGMMGPMNQGQMMSRYQGMLSQMQASDQELDSLAQNLKTVKGNTQKIEIMQKMLERMVENRSQMREQMMAMLPQMMEHMSQHMQWNQKEGNPTTTPSYSNNPGYMMNGSMGGGDSQ